MTAALRARRAVEVRGIVQGVGYRPFIYALAQKHSLCGWVRNDGDGVQVEVEGAPDDLDLFLAALGDEAPPLAVVTSTAWRPLPPQGGRGFHIKESDDGTSRDALVSPDVATCAACLAELFTPDDRRYRYPFITCTHCGPRFTITLAVPYDRARTTMAGFLMCPACRREYEDPADRRFHAQPNACPACGPRVRLVDAAGHELLRAHEDPIRQAAQLLGEGAILALKGLGGYHLACDPCDATAVGRLRQRKARYDRPFALMAQDVRQARALCHVGVLEEALLTSSARPIVLLQRRPDDRLPGEIAPRQRTLGVMLAYTPLHHLLLHDTHGPLVMTSGNRSDEPISYQDEEALAQLGSLADAFLVHDRPIHVRCDDSVTQILGGAPYPVRRSRGAAPAPLHLGEGVGQHTLACGGELKNTFCLARDQQAFLSHHVGDLRNYETYRSFQEGILHYGRLFAIHPRLVAYDLHPAYLSTQYARALEEEGLPAVGVQHHHAHIASCLADNERPGAERVIGVALDGTGYGADGALWGGEFFLGSLEGGFTRQGHLAYTPLPGGEAAIRQPWRMALAYLLGVWGEEDVLRLPLGLVREAGERNVRLVARLIERGLNTPLTSSAGRLFDAIAALLGLPGAGRISYEGQAAVELELAARNVTQTEGYPVGLRTEGDGWIVETGDLISAIVDDLRRVRSTAEIAGRFHRTMAEIVAAGCRRVREQAQVSAVALSGGTWQNRLLMELATDVLTQDGFTVYRHRRVPPNDGGIALGQVVLADRLYRTGKGEAEACV